MTPLPAAIGRYEIESELGRGTMGVVYRARDSVLQRVVALKTIGTFGAAVEDLAAFEQRFLNEARVAAALSHPNIVAVHDFGRDAATGTLFIALEYLEGETLEAVVRRGPLDWRAACRVIASVARALHAAHALGFVHRDVKPANVMLLPSGVPKLMDFGIARLPASDLTRAGEVFGTPSSMSPEQAAGEALDGRSDLFSLGTVLYNLLTGRRAFTGENLPRILQAVRSASPPPPSQSAALPPAVDAVVARALAKDPADRYRTGEEMAQDLEDAVAGRALRHAAASDTAAIPSSAQPRAGGATVAISRAPMPAPSAARRRPWGVLLAVGALVAVVGLAGLARRGGGRAPARKSSTAVEAPDRPRPVEPGAAEPAADGTSRLTVDFEHHLRVGRLKVWVDEDMMLNRELEGRLTQKLGRLRLYKGRLRETVEVGAATHAVRVELAWDGKVRTARTTGAFRRGGARTLDVQILRVLDELELTWK